MKMLDATIKHLQFILNLINLILFMTLTSAKRFTIDEYQRLAELGFFAEDDRVELIKGDIIKMAAKGKAHSVCNTRLYRELFKLIG